MIAASNPPIAGKSVEELQQTISASRLNTWLSCRLKFYFRYVLGLSKPRTGALYIGTSVHGALKRWNQARWRKEPLTVDGLKQHFDQCWHEEQQSEYEMAGIVDGQIFTRTVDRTFIDAGVRWIIDFKTSDHAGGGIDEFLDNEKRRYLRQLERYALLLQAMDTRPVSLGLYFPLLGGWREWSAPFGYEDERLADGERAARAEP